MNNKKSTTDVSKVKFISKIVILLGLVLTNPVNAKGSNTETLYLSDFNNLSSFKKAVSKGLKTDAFQSASLAPDVIRSGVPLRDLIFKYKVPNGLKGICSTKSNKLKSSMGVDFANPVECFNVASLTENPDSLKDVFHVFVTSYNRTYGTPEAEKWLEYFDMALTVAFSPDGYSMWHDKSQEIMLPEMESVLLSNSKVSKINMVEWFFFQRSDSPSKEACLLVEKKYDVSSGKIKEVFSKKCGSY